MSQKKQRADILLYERGLCDSREQAKRLILAGEVYLENQRVEKAGQKLFSDCLITVRQRPQFVGRGGLKLQEALRLFSVNPQGKTCLDVGSSTGGFTDCLLQAGATRVHAIDVGTNQLAWKLRCDERVILKESFNARYLCVDDLGEKVALGVTDVSFISLTLILPAMEKVLEVGGEIICLIKPQFELERAAIGKGGIVRDSALHQRAVEKIRTFVTYSTGLEWLDVCLSPITGHDGNVEFLAYLRR